MTTAVSVKPDLALRREDRIVSGQGAMAYTFIYPEAQKALVASPFPRPAKY